MTANTNTKAEAADLSLSHGREPDPRAVERLREIQRMFAELPGEIEALTGGEIKSTRSLQYLDELSDEIGNAGVFSADLHEAQERGRERARVLLEGEGQAQGAGDSSGPERAAEGGETTGENTILRCLSAGDLRDLLALATERGKSIREVAADLIADRMREVMPSVGAVAPAQAEKTAPEQPDSSSGHHDHHGTDALLADLARARAGLVAIECGIDAVPGATDQQWKDAEGSVLGEMRNAEGLLDNALHAVASGEVAVRYRRPAR